MSNYHVSEDGIPRKCSTTPEKCPLRKEDGTKVEHFSNIEEARKFVEKSFTKYATTTLRKKQSSRIIEKAVEEAVANYFKYGGRSTAKIEPIHRTIATSLTEEGLNAVGKGSPFLDKEMKVKGKYYDKNCDITVVDDKNTPISVVEVKFITTNFKQNANNYFENLLGATTNLKENGVGVTQFIIIPAEIPYLDKNRKITKIEKINNSDIDKYRKWMTSKTSPNNLYIKLLKVFDTSEMKNEILEEKHVFDKVEPFNLEDLELSKENKHFLQKHSDYETLIKNIKTQTEEASI